MIFYMKSLKLFLLFKDLTLNHVLILLATRCTTSNRTSYISLQTSANLRQEGFIITVNKEFYRTTTNSLNKKLQQVPKCIKLLLNYVPYICFSVPCINLFSLKCLNNQFKICCSSIAVFANKFNMLSATVMFAH